MKNKITEIQPKGEIVIYRTKDKKIQLDVKLEQEMVWLAQKQIAALFKTERSVITKHLQNIFENKELEQNSVCAKIAHTAPDGKVYQTTFYNLDVIISVGYRVNSSRATQFRIWATSVLKRHLIDGYTLNEKRLKEQALRITLLLTVIKGLRHQYFSGSWRKTGFFTKKMEQNGLLIMPLLRLR